MAIDAKVGFLSQLERQFSDLLTASTMEKVLSTASDVLEGYEMREVFSTEEPNEDLLDCYLDALKVQGRSPQTIHRYRNVINRMMKAIGVPTRRITVYHLRYYH